MYDVTPVTSPRQTDCGATCLKMLLDYYGQDVPLAQLIEECNTRLIGCSAKDILRAGRLHDLDMKVYGNVNLVKSGGAYSLIQAEDGSDPMTAEELMRQDRPAIIWWMYNHFVVFCGLDEDGKVVICNPDRGRYRVNKGIFKSFYTNVAIFNGEPQDLPTK